MAEMLSNELVTDVEDSVAAYLAKEVEFPAQLARAKTDAEVRELVRQHMAKFAKADREQLFGQPAHA
jgi:hypothetical protein